MSVEQVTAFRISDGKCFGKKEDAFREEILFFHRTLPVIVNRKPTPKEFRKLADEVGDWWSRARALLEQMRDEPDVEVAQKVRSQE